MRLKSSLIAILALAFLCRALIPAGFMPGTADHFSVQLKICPGHPDHTAGGPAPHPHSPSQDHPCVYSAGASSAPPATQLAVLAPVAIVQLPVAFAPPSMTGRILARAQLARGPPRLI